jgi:hypothetical protein
LHPNERITELEISETGIRYISEGKSYSKTFKDLSIEINLKGNFPVFTFKQLPTQR